MKTLLLVLLLSTASCSKLELNAPKACYEFYDKDYNVVAEKCDMTEAEADKYYKKGNFAGYNKK